LRYSRRLLLIASLALTLVAPAIAAGDVATRLRLGATARPLASGMESVLYAFAGPGDGFHPGCVTTDTRGNLYGMTYGIYPARKGGSDNGTVFELSPPPSGSGPWSFTLLSTFDGKDGGKPPTDTCLIADGSGNLYGTTEIGGSKDFGTVFELSPPASGTGPWTETILHAFKSAASQDPLAGLTMDSNGNIYGVTDNGVFRLLPPKVGRKQWVAQVPSATVGRSPAANTRR
jgi:uncharacterized repeat protein (TIGR03803 family)